jgi:hypothetical protein
VQDGARSRRPRRGCLVRVGAGARSRRSVELASYESDLVCGLRWAAFYCGLAVLFFIIDGCGYPHTVGTGSVGKKCCANLVTLRSINSVEKGASS